MDLSYLYVLYAFADPDFYDAAERSGADNGFPLTHCAPPPGWARVEEGMWVALHPVGVKLPSQGWKIHVSACLDNAEDVLGVVWRYCIERNVPFKFLRSRDILLITNSKYADRASSGKFVTLYPAGDSDLERIVTELAPILEGQRGPYILNDLRMGTGPLHVRYGGFLDRYCSSESGDLVPALTSPDGRLVPDVRGPVFQVPPWVQLPPFLADALRAMDSGPPENFPYDIERPLHFSNGGGVYLAQNVRTGRQVVLKEARPHAGLDADGWDAVSRLRREAAILQQLSGLDVVPELLDHVTCWEHHFLEEEYIEGERLSVCVSGRLPLPHGDPSREEVSEYTSWALDILGRIEQALDAVHRRQIIFADFSPRNIVVREDGRICFLDFELASRVDEQSRLVLGSPGFMAPPWCSGLDIDRYALACLRLWIFLPPLTFLLERDPTNAQRFVRVLGERFPVPESFVRELQLGLGVARDGDRRGFQKAAQSFTPASARFLDRERPDWTTLRTSIAEGIAASATPDRPDRLFPGDVNQFRYGGLNLAYGAAGVLYALATSGAGTDPEHVDWLVERSRQARHPHVGLYNGLHGIALLLDHLGRHGDALTILDHAIALTGDVRARGLFGGLAGIGLNLLHFARSAAEQSLREAAGGIAQQLACAVQDPDAAPDLPSAAGLMYGFSGPALLFIHLYEETGDTTFLDLAAAALRRDLAYCQAMSDGALQVLEGHRLMPYLSVGSAGIGLVLGEYLRHRDDEELAAAQACLRRACLGEFVLFSGLFAGRAGLIAYLSREPDPSRGTGGDAALERHLDRLALHALTYRGHVAFPGDQLLRLSMDLATGSAGVLLALHAALDQGACLPFLGARSSAIHPTPAVA